jgi:hypothetical protein
MPLLARTKYSAPTRDMAALWMRGRTVGLRTKGEGDTNVTQETVALIFGLGHGALGPRSRRCSVQPNSFARLSAIARENSLSGNSAQTTRIGSVAAQSGAGIEKPGTRSRARRITQRHYRGVGCNPCPGTSGFRSCRRRSSRCTRTHHDPPGRRPVA